MQPLTVPTELTTSHRPDGQFEFWREDLRQLSIGLTAEFVDACCARDLAETGVDIARGVLDQFVGGGKRLRSTFMYLGWLCGAQADEAAMRAAASLEFVHAFALIQDDVMDGSALRRGLPAAHVQFADWHRCRGMQGTSERFGESAAILLGDLCLVWAEQMLRGSGVPSAAMDRVWRRYDAMRTELAAGQLAELVSVAPVMPTVDAVLDVARRKSGNYTVRRPLEMGADMAGCDERSLWLLGRYGTAIGEAFQLRDDVEGIFGSPGVTGKPASGDLSGQKVTLVVVAAHHMADANIRRQLVELRSADQLEETDLARWRTLIAATGALDHIEAMVAERIDAARELVYRIRIDEPVKAALVNMASTCAAGAR